MEYNVEQKRHWRYWVWKRIAEHCKVHPRFATVLFLAGPSPMDLAAAKKYGFRLENIVAIDSDAVCVKEARKNGCTAIQGNLHEIATKWSDGIIHGIVADYCCGLTLDVAVNSYHLCQLANVVAFNFQRGRESDNESKLLRSLALSKNRAKVFSSYCAMLKALYYESLANGKEAYVQFCSTWIDPSFLYINTSEEMTKAIATLRRSDLEHAFVYMADEIDESLETINIESMTYRSNRVVMDSMISTGAIVRLPTFGIPEAIKTKTDARLSALKAVRTMSGAVRFAAATN